MYIFFTEYYIHNYESIETTHTKVYFSRNFAKISRYFAKILRYYAKKIAKLRENMYILALAQVAKGSGPLVGHMWQDKWALFQGLIL